MKLKNLLVPFILTGGVLIAGCGPDVNDQPTRQYDNVETGPTVYGDAFVNDRVKNEPAWGADVRMFCVDGRFRVFVTEDDIHSAPGITVIKDDDCEGNENNLYEVSPKN